ncbi:hypothetical protein HRbin15_01439 [bacterium HR15]|nr:hypothetical protein HRbin15_01439 [bacterium HR15]
MGRHSRWGILESEAPAEPIVGSPLPAGSPLQRQHPSPFGRGAGGEGKCRGNPLWLPRPWQTWHNKAMPARVLLKNHRWIAWTGGKPFKGEPYEKTGDVLLVAEKPDQPWRTPEIPELDGKMGYCPGNSIGGFITGKPAEFAANEAPRRIAEQNPNFIVLEYFEEPEWEPKPLLTHDEKGEPIAY